MKILRGYTVGSKDLLLERKNLIVDSNILLILCRDLYFSNRVPK